MRVVVRLFGRDVFEVETGQDETDDDLDDDGLVRVPIGFSTGANVETRLPTYDVEDE